MKFTVNKASQDWRIDYMDIIEINTLEELLNYHDKVGHPIIINRNWQNMQPNQYPDYFDCPFDILIYDDYIE